jgi:hypothetical protein
MSIDRPTGPVGEKRAVRAATRTVANPRRTRVTDHSPVHDSQPVSLPSSPDNA